MKKLIVAFVFLLTFTGCTGSCVDDDQVKRAVEKQGYSNVVIKDKSVVLHQYDGCSSSDSAAYKINATNPVGKNVDLVVCAGWPFKGVTIRTK